MVGEIGTGNALREGGVEEVFVVAFHALDGGVDYFYVGALEFGDAVLDALDGGLACGGVSDDAAFAYAASAGFELGFDEDHGFALPALVWSA